MRKIPGIACDIDGVLLRGSSNPIKAAISAINLIRSPMKLWSKIPSSLQLPFVCLTNSGGNLESSKAEQINRLLNLEFPEKKLNPTNIILNFTPFRPIIESYKEKSVLIVGRGKIDHIAEDCRIEHYLNAKEYNCLKKNTDKYPFDRFKLSKLTKDELKMKLLEISAIFILNDPIDWDENIYLISNLLLENPNIPMYAAHNDALYSDEFPLPRFGIGSFNETLLKILEKLNKKNFKLTYSGKPLALSFEFAKRKLKEIAQPFEISNFYMIGDNPNVDVLGGNNNGFKTILVKTGVFKEGNNDKNNPANYVVNDVGEAIELIRKLEDL